MRIATTAFIGTLIAMTGCLQESVRSTSPAERVTKLVAELRHERAATAALRVEWEKIDPPVRIHQDSEQRHLAMR